MWIVIQEGFGQRLFWIGRLPFPPHSLCMSSRLRPSTIASGVLFRSPSRFRNQTLSSDFEKPAPPSCQRAGFSPKYVFHYWYSSSKLIYWIPLDRQIATQARSRGPTEPHRNSVVHLSQTLTKPQHCHYWPRHTTSHLVAKSRTDDCQRPRQTWKWGNTVRKVTCYR